MIKPFPKPRPRVKYMTVCIAALAANFKAIVCVADKALSYGDYIQWDSDSSKIVKINPSGTLLLFSGDEEPSSKVFAKFKAESNKLWDAPRSEIVKTCEDQYSSAVGDSIEAKFIKPRLLDRTVYTTAITAPKVNHLIRSLADEICKFEMGCDLLVCGFDDTTTPFILDVGHPGIATDMTVTGFHAIGSGWDKAVSRLLFSEHKRTHSIGRTLYDLFDAKASAEMAVGVGYEWDAVVITERGFHDVPKDIKDLIESAWGKFTRSPFEKYDPKEHTKGPPSDWKEQLDKFQISLSKSKR